MSRILVALEQIQFARKYTTELLDTIPEDRWFETPGGITHIAWQVWHLTSAQFALAHFRWRGEQPEYESFFPQKVRKLFPRDAAPDPDSSKYPPIAEFREMFNQVYELTLRVVPHYTDEEFDTPITSPHRFCQTRGDCLFWAAAHEMLHAGQIGLVRRLLGEKPMW
jgi:DinB superfamily